MVYDYSYHEPTLVMATKGTIESEKFNMLYHKYDNHKTELLSCVGLADRIEKGNQEEINNYLKKLLKKYKGKIKNVVLGCTHYPLIQDQIKEVLGKNIIFFNGAPNLAKHLQEILKEKKILGENTGIVEFIDSQNSKKKKERFYNYLKEA